MPYGLERGLKDEDRIEPLRVRPLPVTSLPAESFDRNPEEEIEMLKQRLAQEIMKRKAVMSSLSPSPSQLSPLPWGGTNSSSVLQSPLFQGRNGASLARPDMSLPLSPRRI